MKCYLQGSDGSLFQLAPKVTTVGKDNCDITLQCTDVDSQHAVLEYSEQEDCLVLQDLNSSHGTYVNDVRIQNAAVRLTSGDTIQFGYNNGLVFELQIESVTPVSYPPVQQRPAWIQPLTMLTDQQRAGHQHGSRPLPYLSTGTATITIPSTVWTPTQGQPQLPRPPMLRTRPLSAGSNRRSSLDRLQTVGGSPISSTQSPVIQRSVAGSWVNTVSNKTLGGSPKGQQSDLNIIQEKEQKIIQLSEEVNRLQAVEVECYRKDQQLQLLKQEIGQLQSSLNQTSGDLSMAGRDAEFTQKLLELENEVTNKKNEINMLRVQISRMKADTPDNPMHLKEELNEKVRELMNLRNEMDRMKKDKNITSGLVTQMQRDMSNKDSSISKLSREIENCRKDIRERDNQMAAMNAKMTRLKDNSKYTDEKDAREKELISLRQRFKSSENRSQEQQDMIDSMKEELEKCKTLMFEDKALQKQLQSELDGSKAELLDVQRAERVVRVDLEQSSKQLERFRNRVIQVAYSTSDMKMPETVLSDDMLIDALKQIVSDRTQFMRRIQDLENDVNKTATSSEEFQTNVKSLQMVITDIVRSLQSGGHLSSSLKQQIRLLQSVTADESLTWIRDMIISLVESELLWEQAIEESLEKCGVNVKLSSDSPSEHIRVLYAKWELALTERDRLTSELSMLEQRLKNELELQLNAEKRDVEARITEAVEKARLADEERFNRAIDEIRNIESEKRGQCVSEERKKVEEFQLTVEQMRQNLREKEVEEREKLDEAENAIVKLRNTESLVSGLQGELQKLQAIKENEVEDLKAVLQQQSVKTETDVQSYKEQVKQHSVTICAMEERLNKVMKKNTDYQDEISNLKKLVAERTKSASHAKPVLPPKPKAKVIKPTEDTTAMEQVIILLRRDNADIKVSVQDKEDMILGLRKDLAGAAARLSDISGEISEAQKQELEHCKDMLGKRELDLTEVRQKLATLSKIVDKQKLELQSLESQLSKEKSISAKIRGHIDEKAQRLKCLEDRLIENKENEKKKFDVADREGRITSELTAIGAQCHGERHEQVIMRQREALTELRNRIKNMEVAKPPLTSRDNALQQVILLKKELAEMRATHALAEDVNIQNVTSLDREVIRARGKLNASNPDVDLERSAHRETMDALEASENSFLILLRAMASCLEMEDIEGLRPISHIPSDERQRLYIEREQSCELLANRIKILKEKVARKEELLQGYERDLSKMRQAQELEQRKAGQVDNLSGEIRAKTEESQYLRECLSKTREMLEQEKRLNAAIKQKKTFHLENEREPDHSPISHRCKIIDPMGKEVAQRRAQRERSRRKNYEIKQLKDELTEKERLLYDRENRLYTLENSLGLESSA